MNQESDYTLQLYTVLYMDVLNQSEKLESLRCYPSESQREEYINNIRNTAGVIINIARGFLNIFEGLKGGNKPDHVPDDKWSEYKKNTDVEINRQLLSDSMIYYFPMDRSNGKCPEMGVYRLLSSSIFIYLWGLSKGHPMRGAIEIGVAGCFGENGIYGPVLYDVHKYESKIAEYPRIIVGSSLFKYLTDAASKDDGDKQCLLSKAISKCCLDLIAIDADGNYILNHSHRSILTLSDGIADTFNEALAFVHSEYRKYKSLNDSKLAFRYYHLMIHLEKAKMQLKIDDL